MVFEGMFVLGQVLIPITVQNIWLVLAWGMLGFVSALTAIGVLKICDLVLGRPRHIATVTP
jgi:hypothetical protein